MKATRIYFREEQRFKQPWLWAMLIGLALFTVNFIGYGMVKQLVLGKAWGSKPMSDAGLAVFGPCCILLVVGVCALYIWMKLIVEVRDDGLFVRFQPFVTKHFGWPELNHCQPETYRPIAEYGGWGIRRGRKGKAYTVSGNRGVRLVFTNGKGLLLGSQKPTELAGAIAARLRPR
jgi:hypothetical protein